MKQIIPDKICPHCGGNEWEVKHKRYSKLGKLCIYYECHQERLEKQRIYRKKHPKKYRINPVVTHRGYIKNKDRIIKYKTAYRKKQAENLTDYYIKRRILDPLSKNERNTRRQNITQEDINNFRNGEIIICKIKTMKRERVISNNMSSAEKQKVYSDRWLAKKKLAVKEKSIEIESIPFSTMQQYENIAVFGSEPIETKELVPIIEKEKEEDIVDEYKKLQKRQQEIIDQVETFNNYLESLKIKLS